MLRHESAALTRSYHRPFAVGRIAMGWARMSDQEQAELRMMVARLRHEHEDFDAAINAMIEVGCDQLRVQRMKKKKLAIKDKLSKLEDQIIPDIIA